jgi:hypothetical protein
LEIQRRREAEFGGVDGDQGRLVDDQLALTAGTVVF